MAEKKEIYKCEICRNVVEVLSSGNGILVCCSKDMKMLNEEEMDGALEKHVPVVEKNEDGVVVKVGEVLHPMEEEHFIEWVEISTDKGVSKKFLKSGEKPVVKFPVKKDVGVRAYCNLHGLWKSK